MAGDLDRVTRDFSFAPHRFESFCRPLWTVLCLLVPIVMMLVMICEDWRDTKAAQKAEKVLQDLNMRFVVQPGVAADYAELGLRLIREFDVSSQDPATPRVVLDEWERKARSLFAEGCITFVPGDSVGKTARQLASEQFETLGLVDCGGRRINFLRESPTRFPPKQPIFLSGVPCPSGSH